MTYYGQQESKVNIANALRGKGWKIYGYREDQSDSMTDYFSPASWGGIATKNGYVLVVDAYSSQQSGQEIKENVIINVDYNKIQKLEALRDDRAASEGEKINAQQMIDNIYSKEEIKRAEIKVIDKWPVFRASHEISKGTKWHIEKDGALIAKGNGVYKYDTSSLSYQYNCFKMEYEPRLQRQYNAEDEYSKPTEGQEKTIKQFENFINKLDKLADGSIKTGDGTKETESAGLKAEEQEKLIKVKKEKKTKSIKMVEVKRDYFQVGDYITLNHHSHYWEIVSENMQRGKWQGVEDTRKTFTYEILGAASRGYQKLKNPKRYYDYEYLMTSNLENGKIKIFELKEVEENEIIEVWEKQQAEKPAAKRPDTVKTAPEEEAAPVKTNTDVEISFNEEKNGIELKFDGKPSEEIRANLKANGFRWSKYQKIWYAKDTPERREFIKALEGTETEKEKTIYEYPEIDINDLEDYTIDSALSRRENDGNWIFRTKERNHNEELKEALKHYQNKALELLSKTGNKEVIYHIKRDLQRFKKAYYTNYAAILTNKANSPSWAVTGRAGRNASKDQKANDRCNKLLTESAEIVESFNRSLDRHSDKISAAARKENYNNIENTDIELDFKVETKETTYLKVTQNLRTYNYKNYMIVKLWGCFRIFKDGKEIKSMRTTDTLKMTKQALQLLINQQNHKISQQAM